MIYTLDHTLTRLKQTTLKTLQDLIFQNPLQLGHRDTHGEVFRWNDPRPGFVEITNWIRAFLGGR